jgi:hypothetical protein
MSLELTPRQRPRFGRIPEALRYAGISRSRLYEWARERPELLRKNGRASLVDFKVFDEILDTLPPISGAKATTAPSDTA